MSTDFSRGDNTPCTPVNYESVDQSNTPMLMLTEVFASNM